MIGARVLPPIAGSPMRLLCSATRRESASDGPPAENGTTMVTARDGKPCAWTAAALVEEEVIRWLVDLVGAEVRAVRLNGTDLDPTAVYDGEARIHLSNLPPDNEVTVVDSNEAVLRGYPDNAFTGRRYAVFNAEYRFPLFSPQRGFRTAPLFLRHFRPLVMNGHVFVAMPPLYRIDAGKQVGYALDDAERDAFIARLVAEKNRSRPVVTRFKGLGEMSPLQLRETTMDRSTRRLVQLTVEARDDTDQLMDMLLAKKRASDRREWLEASGHLAEVVP